MSDDAKTKRVVERVTEEVVVEQKAGQKVVEQKKIPIVQEELQVGKVLRENLVRIHTGVEEILEPYSVNLERNFVEVEYVDVNEVVTDAPQMRKEDGVTIIPIVEERLVITKELVLLQEVHIKHTARIDTVEDEVALRKTKVDLTRSDVEEGVKSTDESEVLPM